MLPEDRRLRRHSEVAAVYRHGRTAFGRYVAIRYRPNSREVTRFAFSVSRRVGKAVARNRWRRRLREIVRRVLPRVAPGYDVVIRVLEAEGRKDAPLGFRDLAVDVERVFRKAGLLE